MTQQEYFSEFTFTNNLEDNRINEERPKIKLIVRKIFIKWSIFILHDMLLANKK